MIPFRQTPALPLSRLSILISPTRSHIDLVVSNGQSNLIQSPMTPRRAEIAVTRVLKPGYYKYMLLGAIQGAMQLGVKTAN